MKKRDSRGMAILGGILCFVMSGSASGLPKFTAEQLKALEAGELVKVSIGPKENGGLSGGKSYILLGDDRDTCFAVVKDIKNYYYFYDDTLIEATVVKTEKNKRTIKMVYGKGPLRMTYYSDYTLDKKNYTVKFKINQSYSNDLSDALGYIKFSPFSESKVLMTNVTLVDFGDNLALKLVGGKITSGMLRLPEYVKRFLAEPMSKKYRMARN